MARRPPGDELAEFQSHLHPIVRKALDWDFSSFTQEEWSEYIHRQDEVEQLRTKLEPILRKMPAKWNQYCKAQKKFFDAAIQAEASLTLAKGLSGRPSKDARANVAEQLRKARLSWAKIAMRLNRESGLNPGDKDYATGGSIRKLLKRREARQCPSPDKIRK